MRLILVCAAIAVLGAAFVQAADELLPNSFVPDGGFEQTKEVMSSDQYMFQAVQSGMDLGEPGPFVVLPSNFSQFCSAKKLRVVEGTPGKEVHSGKRAVLLDGSFYLNANSPAKTGDVFKAVFWAKGPGKARVILYLTNTDGKYFGQGVPDPAPADPNEWRRIEQRIETKNNPNLKSVWVRVETLGGEVAIDDLSVVKE